MLKSILAAVDGSDASMRAVAFAANLTNAYNAKLTVMHVQTHIGSSQVPEGLREYADIEHVMVTEGDVLRSISQEILRRAQTAAVESGAREVVTIDDVGDVAERIVSFAKRHHPDLIVMGTRGLGVLKELALGSVSHKVIHLAPCPTATIH